MEENNSAMSFWLYWRRVTKLLSWKWPSHWNPYCEVFAVCMQRKKNFIRVWSIGARKSQFLTTFLTMQKFINADVDKRWIAFCIICEIWTEDDGTVFNRRKIKVICLIVWRMPSLTSLNWEKKLPIVFVPCKILVENISWL